MQAETRRSRVYLFGPLAVETREADGSWKPVERSVYSSNDYASNVLKRLLSFPGRRLSRGQIQEAIWPGLESDVDNYLDRAIGSIRKALGSKEFVRTWRGTYEVAGQDMVWVDADAAEALVTKAENLNNPVASIPLLEEALSYFQRGIYLEQENGAYVHEVRKGYEMLLKRCRLWLAEGYAALGKYLQASLQYQALILAPWIDEETQDYCREQQALVEAQERVSRKPVVSDVLQETVSPTGLEIDMLALAWRWKPSFGSIAMLQQLFHERIRKYPMMHHPMSRRQALQAIALFPIEVYGVTLFSAETVLLPSEEMIPLCAAGITACWELRRYEAEGMQAIERTLALYLPTLEKLARATSSSQKDAARLASQGYLPTTLLAGRQDKLAQMETASRMARYYAQVAQEASLEISALIRLGEKYSNENRHTKALEAYQEAAALPGFSSVSPLLQASIYASLAGKLSYCQQADEALSFLSQAKEIYPVEPESDPSFAFAFCSKSAFAVWEGLTLERTHRYTEAADTFSRFGSLTPLPGVVETNRAENLIYVASVATKQSNLDQASLYLDTALEIAQMIRHKQRQREIQETLGKVQIRAILFDSVRLVQAQKCQVYLNHALQEMQQIWPQEPKVKALQEKIYA